MSASPADRGLSLVKLDLGLDFLRILAIILQPKGDGKGGLGDLFYLWVGIIDLAQGPHQSGGDHSSSGSSMNPWLSTTLPFCVIGT